METTEINKKYLKAKKRVEELKGFYIHLGFYITVNLFISGAQVIDGITEDKSVTEIFSDFGMYAVWLIWGLGIFFHWLGVFESKVIGKNWEERKLKEILDKNKRNHGN
ncbi:MAG: hypothetical protein ACI8WA_000943 [Polaribacter sp.]|jgi:hypothetical protein